ncbi:DUF928 domain-containing protein [Fortiea contorta]|uniref:DUF928 domain-containing protein n=1 Tax=Fortiea contorta TaxID=1892405 RepID=UPI00034C1A3E|nr:DUF928 domain-containing protein [Fortiea contorta]
MTAFPVLAEFKPRDRTPATPHTRAGGSRRCSSQATQLAPQTFVSKTASTRPTLAWHMSSPQNVRFRIFEFYSDKDLKIIGDVKEISATAGINKLKLPLDYPELKVGKTYLWQIALDCETDIEVNRAEFIVIDPGAHAKQQFSSIPESVNYYAENGLWYEALEEALKSSNPGKLGQNGANLVKDLAQLELLIGNDADQRNIQKRIKRLQTIGSDR